MNDYIFWVYRDKAREWRWLLWNTKNRKSIAVSGEGYTTKQGCENGIRLVKAFAPTAPIRYDQRTT